MHRNNAELDDSNEISGAASDADLRTMEEGLPNTKTNTTPTTMQPPDIKMPEFKLNCLDSLDELKFELDRMQQCVNTSRSLPASGQPYGGDRHKQRQALSRTLVEMIKMSGKPNSFKRELVNTAINHKLFDNQTLPLAKRILTGAIRTFWTADNPSPIMPSNSQLPLLTYRGELIDLMKAEVPQARGGC